MHEYKFITLSYAPQTSVVYASSDDHRSLQDEATGESPEAQAYLEQLLSEGWRVIPSQVRGNTSNTRVVVLERRF